MPTYNATQIINFLRNEVITALDEVRSQAINNPQPGAVSTQAKVALDSALSDFKAVVTSGAVSLDVLTRLDKTMSARIKKVTGKAKVASRRRRGRDT